MSPGSPSGGGLGTRGLSRPCPQIFTSCPRSRGSCSIWHHDHYEASGNSTAWTASAIGGCLRSQRSRTAKSRRCNCRERDTAIAYLDRQRLRWCRDSAILRIRPPNPLSSYGASKLAGEKAIQSLNARHLIVRTAWLFWENGASFLRSMHSRSSQPELRAVSNQYGSSTTSRTFRQRF